MKATLLKNIFAGCLSLWSVCSQAQCAAAFTYTVGSNGQVSFTNTSSGTGMLTSYTWSFGDNSSSNQQSPGSHTYAFNGSYNVALYISDSLNGGNCSDVYNTTVVITNTATCNLAVSYTYSFGSNGLVNFTNTSTGINTGMSILWTFSDGTVSNQSSPSHTFPYNGIYNVTLNITDSTGYCSGNFNDSLTITNAQNPPSCSATITYTLGSGGLVNFTGSQTGTIPIPSYSWNFGDGGYANSTVAPSHTYAYNGTYNVYFYVADSLHPNYGCSYYQQVVITNTTAPTCQDSVYFTLSQDTSQASTWDVYLYSNHNNTMTNAYWSWGDGTYTSGLYPSHTYASPGMYNICVTAVFACGDSSTFCSNDSVYRSSAQMVSVHVINPLTGIQNHTNSMTSLQAYPNPFTDNITVKLTSYENKAITCSVFDMMGNLMLKQNVLVNKGDNEFKLQTTEMGKGVYFIQVSVGNGKASTLKVVK